MSNSEPKKEEKPKRWFTDPKVRSVFWQTSLVLITLYLLSVIIGNTIANLEDRSIKTTFTFLNEVATFSIPLNFNPLWDFVLGESIYWDVFIIGIQNTILVALMGIPAAMIVGLIVGVVQLSPNWLLSKVATAYVEIFRNTPLLLQLLFWHFAFFPPIYNSLPPVRESILVSGMVFNNAGFYLPSPVFGSWTGIGFLVLLVAMIAAIWYIKSHATKVRIEEGKKFPTFWISLGIIVGGLSLFMIVAGDLISVEFPEKKGLNYSGGIRPPKELISLWMGLTVYTSTYIAENVRGGILSVSVGQSEAGMALGLRRTMRMRLIILPQALRVIIPPTISQFLNLTKNSSLAVAVGYPDITNIWLGIALNQTGQALIIVFMTIAVYETINLLTSYLTNVYNKRVQITER